ncbi:MAG: chemotaxis protein CheD [Pseudomonadota bacterium]
MSSSFRKSSTYIAQGEQAIGSNPEDIITTTLGSCVAVCLWDSVRMLGGMNHILLPDFGDWSRVNNFGGSAMDRLVNALLKEGADRRDMRAKVFGGAAMIAGLSDIGHRNAAFVRAYLKREGIPCDAESTGGEMARQVKYWPHDGRARQRLVSGFEEPAPKPQQNVANDIELF